jgi:hypothetical protein
MTGYIRIAAFLLVAGLASVALADFSINDSKLTVSFQGNSGHIVFTETSNNANATNAKQWWAVVWAGITECDGTKGGKGNKASDCSPTTNKITNFANSFVFTPVQESTYDGVKQLSVNATATTDVGTSQKKSVTFTIYNSLFEQAVIYQNVSVPAHAFKFGFEISAWPFLDASNYLSVQLTVMNKDGSQQSQKGSTVQMGGRATLTLDDTITVDGVAVPVTTAMATNGNNNNLYVSVPNYARTAVYDPVFELGSGSSGSDIGFIVGITILLVAAAVVALLLIVALVVVFLRRQREAGDSIYRPM